MKSLKRIFDFDPREANSSTKNADCKCMNATSNRCIFRSMMREKKEITFRETKREENNSLLGGDYGARYFLFFLRSRINGDYVAVCALFEEIHGGSNLRKDNGRAQTNA